MNKPNKNLPRSPDLGKVPPQAVDIEEAILGAILLEGSAFVKVSHYFSKTVLYVEAHQKIIECVSEIFEEGGGIDILTVAERLKRKGLLEEVGGATFISKLTSKVASSKHLDFHCRIITDKYLLRELIRIGMEMAHKSFNEDDPKEIAEWAETEIMENFDLEGYDKSTFKEALNSTLKDISDKSKGIITSFIQSGDPLVDESLAFRERSICLIAGAEGHAKTKYSTYLAKSMLDKNDDLALLWFSMEDTKEQIIRSFISSGAKLTTKQLQSINYTISSKELEDIARVTNSFKAYPIEFVDRVVSIKTIIRKARSFADKHRGKRMMIIIDNLGLIMTDSWLKGIEKDDYLAGKIKEISDELNAFIVLLHHITKDAAKKFNIKEGYRPRKEYVRGSSRILDYVQQAVLVNLPKKYKDLLVQEKSKSVTLNIPNEQGSFDRKRFNDEFWTINPKGDKFTKDVTDLQKATWDSLKFLCQLSKLPDGSPIRVGFLLKKYIEYSVSVDDKNREREERFYEQKLSIYTFLEKKMYLEDYSPVKDSRSWYLYGNNMQLAKSISELFIVEVVKNRDGGSDEDDDFLRYLADLSYNEFKPIIPKKDG